tara:strand:- start:324 stop:512 length:189 start_codon:yes stop_codon:yes gene_type:complete
MKRTLNVKLVSTKEISDKWGFPMLNIFRHYYMRCNAKGVINWDTSKAYTPYELVGRDKVVVK